MRLSTLFVDLNSYFASVEQQMRPHLRGRPVGIVAVDAETTCCLAASYEAKRHGVKTGTGVRDARKLCPDIVFVKARPHLYVEFHHKILAAADTVLPVHEVHSIDEFSCRLLGKERDAPEALRLGRAMKDAIRARVGPCMTCSVGIASSRFLAKIGSDMQKPDGLTLIDPCDMPRRLFGLKLQDLPGIGPRMDLRLRRKGLHTVEELCAKTEPELLALWESVVGSWWYRALRGEDLDWHSGIRRTVGHSHVLPPVHRDEEGSRAVLVRLIHKAAARTRALGYVTRRLTVAVRYLDQTKWKDELVLPETSDTLTLVEQFARMWAEKPKPTAPPLKVSMVLSDLAPMTEANLALFEDARRREALSKTMDTVNEKFGRNSVYLASMHAARDSAPTRIAFNHIPDLLLPDSRDRDEDSD